MFVSYDRKKNALHYTPNPTPPSEAMCDFCISRAVTHSCAATDIKLPGGSMSVGSWAACSSCALYVGKEDRAGLAEHAIRRMQRAGLEWTAALYAVTSTHSCFWKAKLGAPVPLESD